VHSFFITVPVAASPPRLTVIKEFVNSKAIVVP
jgi:hypothetical protein